MTPDFCLIPIDGRDLNNVLKLTDWTSPEEAVQG